ncbi:hypothetical protein QMO31_32275, partial [Pseudomonas aeruginosa]|nr:hypothetical protein [Pseudomonas aeruginosa]
AAGITLFESAAILQYLAETSGRLLPDAPRERWEALTWLTFHASSMGPILGQRVHFEIFAEERYPPAIERYRRPPAGGGPPPPPPRRALCLRAPLHRGIRCWALPVRGLRSQFRMSPNPRDHSRQVCGFRDDGLLPPTYPHILAFPLQMALLTDKRFPFPLLGLVHLENRIDVLR